MFTPPTVTQRCDPDMSLVSNVVRRGAVYYFRRRVPPQIQSIIGKALIRESLDTREPKVARRLAADRNMHWERKFEEAEAKLAPKAAALPLRADLTDAEVQTIVDDYRRHLLWSDEQIRLHGLGGQQSGLPDHQYDLLTEVFQDIEKFAANDIARGRHLSPANRAAVNEQLARMGISLQENSVAYKRIAVEFLNTMSECIQLWKDRHAGKVVRTPAPQAIVLTVKAKLTAADLIAGWKAERSPKAKTVSTFSAKLQNFEAYLGGRGLETATPEDASNWKAARLAEGNTHKSVQNDLYAAKAVFGWAAENHKIAQSPFKDTRISVKKGKRSSKRPYTDEEAVRVLRAARSQKGGMRWIPWINAAMGVRVAEAAQLNRDDIKTERGIWYADINEIFDDDDDENEGSDGEIKSVKTETSNRQIPIPSKLIAEGFIEFVKTKKPGEPLFADIALDVFGSRGGTASKRICRFVREKVGIKDKKIAPNHSFRHRFKDLCRNAGLTEEVHDALTGHEGGGEGRKYGLGFMVEFLAPAIEKIKWVDLD